MTKERKYIVVQRGDLFYVGLSTRYEVDGAEISTVIVTGDGDWLRAAVEQRVAALNGEPVELPQAA